MRNLLEISRESLKTERRKHVRRTALALALLLAAALGTVWYRGTYVRGEIKDTIVLKETVGNQDYLYVEREGHLLRLKCGEGVDFNGIELENEWGQDLAYLLDCRWNRRTYEGTVYACQFYGESLGGLMDSTFEVESKQLFWYDEVHYTSEHYYPDPYGEPRGQRFLCDYRFWTGTWDEETVEGPGNSPGGEGLRERPGGRHRPGRVQRGGSPHPLAREALCHLRLGPGFPGQGDPSALAGGRFPGMAGEAADRPGALRPAAREPEIEEKKGTVRESRGRSS